MGRRRYWLARGLAAIVSLTAVVSGAWADDEVAPPFARFEGLIGGWKGTGVNPSNRVKGWAESHAWAWKFAKGRAVGVVLTVEGGKVFRKAELSFDDKAGRYNLAASDLSGKPASYSGGPTADGKAFVFDRAGPTAEGKERLTIRPTSNGIRYTMRVDHQAAGAPQYKTSIDVGLTKEGESFAAGAGGADLPKCIITGGTATMTVSHDGKAYPICCTGCRDEFADNPQKYLARLASRLAADPDKPAAPEARPAPASRGSGEFDGLVDMPPPKAGAAKPKDAPSRPAAAKKNASDDRAGRELKLGQASEKGGKTKQALEYYRGVVKKYPDTEAAMTARGRIKALEKDK